MRQPLYVVKSPRRLELFQDPVGQALVLNQTLEQWQQRAAGQAKLDIQFVDHAEGLPAPCFVMADDVFTTGKFLAEFAQRARILGRNCQAGLVRSPVLEPVTAAYPVTRVDGGTCCDLRYVTDFGDTTYHPLLLIPDDLTRTFLKLPGAVSDHGGTFLPYTAKSIMHVRCPLHVLQANMHANIATTPERLPKFTFRRRVKVNLVGDPDLLTKWNRVGKGCDIHPTAWVEGCELGHGVVIGPNAVCRYSVIGDGAQVLDGAVVTGSVVGSNSMVSQQVRVLFSVVYPEAFLNEGALDFSIMGRSAGVYGATVAYTDMDKGSVATVVDGATVDSGLPFLGCALGHRSKLGPGVVTAPGVLVPNDLRVRVGPAAVLSGVPKGHASGTTLLLGK
jgi:carbonic anhydrase/acetyltransferase-like protein (isoleucine patch superfamily)